MSETPAKEQDAMIAQNICVNCFHKWDTHSPQAHGCDAPGCMCPYEMRNMYLLSKEREAPYTPDYMPGDEMETVPGYLADDEVAHPAHYTSHASGIECIEITRHMSFNLGNAVKYIWRADEKGSPVTDLEKAVWYIQDEIARRKGSAL